MILSCPPSTTLELTWVKNRPLYPKIPSLPILWESGSAGSIHIFLIFMWPLYYLSFESILPNILYDIRESCLDRPMVSLDKGGRASLLSKQEKGFLNPTVKESVRNEMPQMRLHQF